MRVVVAATLGVVVLATVPSPTWPNGGTVRLVKVPAGPYLVSAWTEPGPPRVGRLDLSVVVMRPGTEEAVLDVTARVRAERVDSDAAPFTATLVPGNPPYAHALLELPTAGRWRIVLAVAGPGGTGEAAFELGVEPPSPLFWVLLPGLLVGLGVVWWLARQSERRKS